MAIIQPMSQSLYHSVSSKKKFGGQPEDFLPIHEWIDSSRLYFPNYRHRCFFHHNLGIATCIQIFGSILHLSNGAIASVFDVAEKHIVEDLGWLPLISNWGECIQAEPWMHPEVHQNKELTPFDHALKSADLFGAEPEIFMPIHQWLDESQYFFPDYRHQYFRHHTLGIVTCTKVFGTFLALPNGTKVPVAEIAKQHIQDDLGFIPTPDQWGENIRPQPWMKIKPKLTFKRQLETTIPIVKTELFPPPCPMKIPSLNPA